MLRPLNYHYPLSSGRNVLRELLPDGNNNASNTGEGSKYEFSVEGCTSTPRKRVF